MSKKAWIYSFFTGEKNIYEQAYDWIITKERTEKEVEAVLNLLKPEPGSHILDWCGGWGRHAIELAKRGFKITLLDFSPEYIKRAEKAVEEANVEINAICADFRKTPSSIQADCAINMFTAGMGYLKEIDDLEALKSLHAALKPGAKFMLDTMSLFWIVRDFQEKKWSFSPDDTKIFLEERKFNFWTNRIRTRFILLDKTRRIEQEESIDHHIYSPAELVTLLRKASFEPIKLYGGFDGSEFDFDSRRIIIVSDRC